MEDDLIGGNENALLTAVRKAAPSIQALRTWFTPRFAPTLPDTALPGKTIEEQILKLLQWARSENGGVNLLQKLADDPPNGDQGLPSVIYAVTGGKIQACTGAGPEAAEPHLSFFATDRPFVNRDKLRSHLEHLEKKAKPGANCILVIDGNDLSGKSFSIRLATQCHPSKECILIDVVEFQENGAQIDALELAKSINEYKSSDYPSYDATKEQQHLPALLCWLESKLKLRAETVWIIIDHCNRPAMTDGARNLLVLLAKRIDLRMLPKVRLLLIDFDKSMLPEALRANILTDTAKPPDQEKIVKWAQAMADAEKRQCLGDELKAWATDAWNTAAQHQKREEFYLELDRQLRQLSNRIRACQGNP